MSNQTLASYKAEFTSLTGIVLDSSIGQQNKEDWNLFFQFIKAKKLMEIEKKTKD